MTMEREEAFSISYLRVDLVSNLYHWINVLEYMIKENTEENKEYS